MKQLQKLCCCAVQQVMAAADDRRDTETTQTAGAFNSGFVQVTFSYLCHASWRFDADCSTSKRFSLHDQYCAKTETDACASRSKLHEENKS